MKAEMKNMEERIIKAMFKKENEETNLKDTGVAKGTTKKT